MLFFENIWNVMKMKMKMKALNPRPRSHAGACLEICGNLENHIREQLVETFRERLVKCLAANGDIIKFYLPKRGNRNKYVITSRAVSAMNNVSRKPRVSPLEIP
jgi:hypothetical protein